jgi:MOSC domain-containing protein YiiM
LVKFLIESVLTGPVMQFTDTGERSAIAKAAVTGPRDVRWLGIAGDAQADLSVHGGPDKAIHHYPRDHYAWWQDRIGTNPLLDAPGAFGENISTTGLTEHEACIGDRYRLGTALVEIAQGRQPCWKQAHRLSYRQTVATMVKTGRSGWYYRVIDEGAVAAGDLLNLVARPHAEWTVARVTAMIVAGAERDDPATWHALSGLCVLADGWRARAAAVVARAF